MKKEGNIPKDGRRLPDAQQVKAMLAGELAGEEKLALEKQLADSPWGEDAMEGWKHDLDLSGMENIALAGSTSPTGSWSILKYMSVIIPLVGLGVAIWYFYPKTNEPTSAPIVATKTVPTQQPNSSKAALPIATEEEEKEAPQVVVEASITDSSFSFTLAEPKEIALVEEEPEEHFMEVERIEIPETIPTRPIDEDVLEEESPTRQRPAHPSFKTYHIRDYKVVDYRGIREGSLTTDDLSLSGRPAGQSIETILHENIIKFEHEGEQIPYVEWLEYAMVAFAQEQYKKANKRFNVILIDYPDDANALFYKGMAYFYSQEYEKAARFLARSTQADFKTFYEESQFYLAEALWEAGEDAKAKKLFKQIAEEGGYYAERAALKNP